MYVVCIRAPSKFIYHILHSSIAFTIDIDAILQGDGSPLRLRLVFDVIEDAGAEEQIGYVETEQG